MDMTVTNPPTDPYLWLEDVQGERALGWVREPSIIAANRGTTAYIRKPTLAAPLTTRNAG